MKPRQKSHVHIGSQWPIHARNCDEHAAKVAAIAGTSSPSASLFKSSSAAQEASLDVGMGLPF